MRLLPPDDLPAQRRRVYLVLTGLGLSADVGAMGLNEILGIADPVSRTSGLVLLAVLVPVLLTRGRLQALLFTASLYVYTLAVGAAWGYGLFFRFPDELGQVTLFTVALWLPALYALFFVNFRPGPALAQVGILHLLFVAATLPHASASAEGTGLLDGFRFPIMLALAHGGLILLVYGFARLAPELRAAQVSEAALRHLAYHDPLTGLPNRRQQQDEAERILAHARRGLWPVTLLYLDLDHFKAVNDEHGHATGDRLLQAVVARVHSVLREQDHLARIGGDEFSIVLVEAGPKEAAAVCERILAALTVPFELDGHSLRIGASVGAALHPTDAEDLPTLLRLADRAMYVAKESGGGYHFHGREASLLAG